MNHQRKAMFASVGRLIGRLTAGAGMAGLVAGLGLVAVPGPAQSEALGFVKLEELSGKSTIWGELMEFDGTRYVLKSNVGVMEIEATAVRCIGDACPKIPKRHVNGGEVVLKAREGGSEIRGKLVGFDGKAYTVRTVLGDFRIASHIADCHGPGCPRTESDAPKFAVYGFDSAMARLVPGLWRGFAEAKGYHLAEAEEASGGRTLTLTNDSDALIAEVSLKTGNPDGALRALSAGEAEIAVLEQDPSTSRLGAALREPGTFQQALIGYDGLVLVANEALPVRDMGANDIQRIWRGQLRNWQALGGGDYPITLHVADGSLAEAPAAFLQLARLGNAGSGTVVYHDSEEEVIAAVEADRSAIGVVHHDRAAIADARMLGLRKVCGLTASPSAFDMQVEHYPLTMPIRAIGRGQGTHPIAQDFLDWTRTAEAQGHVSEAGFKTAGLKRMKIRDMGMSLIHTAAVEPDFDGIEFASMMRELRYADRLSITFRFLPGSSRLDEESVQNIRYLAERLRAREFDGQELLLVGFADSIGPADRNTVLAGQRAEAVREVLAAEFNPEALRRLQLRTLSFGEQMPIDCNDTDTGRANNRRVEVWTRVAGGV